MKNKNYMVFVWAALVALIIMSIPTAIRLGPEMIGKKFIDSHEFQGEMEGFYYTLSTTVLNPIQFDEAKGKIIVTDEEIEEHRMRYGNLSDQVMNIQEQYEGRITEAEESGNEQLKETLIKERDTKIADIELNFESDEHVEKKVLAGKVSALKQFLAENQQSARSAFPIAYHLTDVKTGEVFTQGDVDVPAIYKKTFGEVDDYFKANTVISESEYNHYSVSYYDDGYELTAADFANIQQPVRQFEGVIVVSEKALQGSYLKDHLASFNKKKYRNYTLWILSIGALYLLLTKIKFKKKWVTENRFVRSYNGLKIDVKVFIFMFSLLLTFEFIHRDATGAFFYNDYYSGAWMDQLFWLIALAMSILFLAFQLVNSIERWKQAGVFERDFAESYVVSFLKSFQTMFLNRTLGVQMFILLIGFFLAGFGFAIVAIQPFLILAYLPAVFFLGLPVLYIFVKRSAYLNRIFSSTEKMANGTLHEEIKVKGKSPLANHARHLNQLREGVQISISEQAKSERLKTELITNVSHDLRTPLTSIITYTDLLKSTNLTEEDRLKYVDIIDKKSARLKTLIEDLFEVSKMASGNLELHKQKVDLTQLLQQALAENEEEISNSSLDFRVQLPESALVADVDGQRWWRVLDNLIVNALKYSMSGTRVYLYLDRVGDRAQFVVKNISKYELSENSDELFERFKRADTSRHTDGSGLGLAIAQSIVEMHEGDMQIDIDGDLFKVTVEIPVE
ncbi:MFS domain-containing histidine kinase [Sporosarcina pasteurii]|uniref:histidine kinase n=1 Tax=Sporosarcina pasteurii TaxID=1474 RepID=A0A380BDU2_SPOPA|nr:MFS domain-containing histidine kinase [Sporosarcina pasteurii]MDS9472827.1 MFS domain-containing histidine kinase [Sporosarcina pasteurii]QBQ06382.1 GHKL domain-containing protein [Sporosarcina pasteurii]SUI98804.1 Sensor protein kinase walK [Sporosarcina pasteurii]